MVFHHQITSKKPTQMWGFNPTDVDPSPRLFPKSITNLAVASGFCRPSYWKLPFIVDFPVKMVIFQSYVSLPEGKLWYGGFLKKKVPPWYHWFSHWSYLIFPLIFPLIKWGTKKQKPPWLWDSEVILLCLVLDGREDLHEVNCIPVKLLYPHTPN